MDIRTILSACLVISLCVSPSGAQIPPSAYPARRAAAMTRLGADLLIVPARASLPDADQRGFVQAPDFQYLTGLEELIGAVLVLDGEASTAMLFVPPPHPRLTRRVLSPDAASAPSLQLSDLLPIGALESWLRERLARRPTTVFIASTDAGGSTELPPPMARSLVRWRVWLTALGAAEISPATMLLSRLREIKDEHELSLLRRVAIASRDAALAAIRRIAPGTWEHDTELVVVSACRAAGARGVSFWPWTLSGSNARFPSPWQALLAYDHLDREMKAGELVRVDIGCQVDHYMGDVGRTVPVSGAFSDGQREAWDLLIAAYRAGLASIRDGISAQVVFEAARAEVRRRTVSLKTSQGRRAAAVLLAPNASDVWSLHGVGLQDAEGSPTVLRAGMVVAYEPSFIVDDDAFYLEDMISVTSGGYELLTAGLPYTAREIEAVMRKRARPGRRF